MTDTAQEELPPIKPQNHPNARDAAGSLEAAQSQVAAMAGLLEEAQNCIHSAGQFLKRHPATVKELMPFVEETENMWERINAILPLLSQIEICQKEPSAYQSKQTELLYELDATEVDFAEMWPLFRRYGE